MATKPYVSSAAYLQRMGDFCADCTYDPKLRTGARACPFNALYWDFVARHRKRLAAHPRMALMVRQLDRLDAGQRRASLDHAAALRTRQDTLSRGPAAPGAQ